MSPTYACVFALALPVRTERPGAGLCSALRSWYVRMEAEGTVVEALLPALTTAMQGAPGGICAGKTPPRAFAGTYACNLDGALTPHHPPVCLVCAQDPDVWATGAVSGSPTEGGDGLWAAAGPALHE